MSVCVTPLFPGFCDVKSENEATAFAVTTLESFIIAAKNNGPFVKRLDPKTFEIVNAFFKDALNGAVDVKCKEMALEQSSAALGTRKSTAEERTKAKAAAAAAEAKKAKGPREFHIAKNLKEEEVARLEMALGEATASESEDDFDEDKPKDDSAPVVYTMKEIEKMKADQGPVSIKREGAPAKRLVLGGKK